MYQAVLIPTAQCFLPTQTELNHGGAALINLVSIFTHSNSPSIFTNTHLLRGKSQKKQTSGESLQTSLHVFIRRRIPDTSPMTEHTGFKACCFVREDSQSCLAVLFTLS